MKLSAFRDPTVWFLILLATCVIAPYLLGVRPRTRGQWNLIAITMAFVAWVLLGQVIPVR